MENFNIQISKEINKELAKECGEIMPCGHIGVCCMTSDRSYAENIMSNMSSFDYKITFIEYPDDVKADEDNVLDIVESEEDIRLFVGVGGREIATLVARASGIRGFEYIFVANSPDIYGVAYELGNTRPFENYDVRAPKTLYIDALCTDGKKGFSSLVGIILGHAVELFEKQYINKLCGKFDEKTLNDEKALIDATIGDGDMSDRERLLKNIVLIAKSQRDEFCSAQKVLSDLIEEMSLTYDKGESSLLAAVTLIKYFKAILSVKDGSLTIPEDVCAKCRNIAKLVNADISEIIKRVEKRSFEPKWLFIHKEYREDLLKDIEKLENKLLNILRSAKRFMADAGYHLSEEYDSNMLIQAVYNLSPLTDDCSPVSIADCLGIG